MGLKFEIPAHISKQNLFKFQAQDSLFGIFNLEDWEI